MGSIFFPDTLLIPALLTNGCIVEGRIEAPGFTSWYATNLTLGAGTIAFVPGFEMNVVGDLTLSTGARLHLQAMPTNTPGTVGAQLNVSGDLHVADGAWIHPHADGTNGAVVGIHVGGDVTIAAGGGIDAEGDGYAPMSGNGNGPGAGQGSTSGGGYGGRGGGPAGGATYGSAVLPLAPGSPGGWYLYGAGLRAGQGGGAIRLLAGGDVRLDGTLKANAMLQEPNYGGRGASGGAIFVAARRLTGSGVMQASGTLNRSLANADGGGGRIAVWVGLPPGAVDSRIASGDATGVSLKSTYGSFGGTLEALRASAAAEDGTTGIYGISSTVLLIR